jgi:hypothetical protein
LGAEGRGFKSLHTDHIEGKYLDCYPYLPYAGYMPAMIELKCGNCQKLFLKMLKHVTAARKLGQTVFYCGLSCSKRKDVVKDVCHACGVAIEMRQSVRRSKSGFYYCSRSCAVTENNKIYKRKENHPNWTGGKSNYRHGRELKRCAECGETRAYLLTVHHRDRNRSNNDPDNLEDLCANCHITRHLVVRKGKLVLRWGMTTSDEAKILMKEFDSCNIFGVCAGSNPVSPTILNEHQWCELD